MAQGQNFSTIGEVVAALEKLSANRGKRALIQGNLKSALWDISTAMMTPAIFEAGEEGNIAGVLSEIKALKLHEDDVIFELRETYPENRQQQLDEERGTRDGTVDAARVKALVDEYELHLKNNEGDPKKAAEAFLKKYEKSPEVKELLNKLEGIKADCKNQLGASDLKGEELDRAAQTLAEEVIVQEEKAREVGIDPQKVNESLINNAVEALQRETRETETIDQQTKAVAEEVKEAVNETIKKSDEALAEKQKYALDLAESAELTAQKIILDHQMELAKEGLLKDLEEANKIPNSNGTLKIDPEVFNQKDNLGRALSSITAKNLGQLDHNEVIEELRLKGFDVGAVGEEIKEYIKGINKLLDNNPRTATYVAQLESQRAIAAEIIQVNPQASTQSAYEYAGLATRFDGAFIGTNRAKIISDAQRELDEQGERGKDRPSYNGLSSKLTELQMMAGLATMSPDEYNKFNEEYKNLRGKFFNIPEGAGSLKLRSLDNVLSLFNKDERLQGVLKLLQKNGGIRKLAEGWATASQNGLLGKALAGLAKSGLGEGAQSFFTWAASGSVFRKGLETGLAAVGKRLAGTAAGKIVVSIGAKLGLSAIGGAVTGGIGWLVAAGMFALDIGKNIFSNLSKSLGGIGLDLLGDAKKLLQDLGMDNPVGKALGLLGLIGAGIVGLIGSALAAAAIPVVLISAVIGMFMGYTQMNLGTYASFRPDAEVLKTAVGGGGVNQIGDDAIISYTDLIPPLDPNIKIEPACPEKGLWPASGTITQGNHLSPTATSHNSSWVLDHEAVDIGQIDGEPVYTTHDGYAVIINSIGNDGSPSGYGYHVIVYGKGCNGHDYVTIYGHMLSYGRTGGYVKAGQQIGLVDHSGNSYYGSHLHYSLVGLGSILNYLPETNNIGTAINGGK